jgi:hypothetical protein
LGQKAFQIEDLRPILDGSPPPVSSLVTGDNRLKDQANFESEKKILDTSQ